MITVFDNIKVSETLLQKYNKFKKYRINFIVKELKRVFSIDDVKRETDFLILSISLDNNKNKESLETTISNFIDEKLNEIDNINFTYNIINSNSNDGYIELKLEFL